MPIKRLVLSIPKTDGVNDFPYVDVRLAFAGTFGTTKAGASLTTDYVLSPFTAQLRLRFYRLESGKRIFLAENYRVLESIFEANKRIRRPTGTDLNFITAFWDYLYIGTTANLANNYSVNMDDLRDQASTENPFEALDINAPLNFQPMIDCLRFLLEYEAGPDFAGLSVVEDVA